jgi:TetR/AcrR family transcriptional regulator, transcriptional repressor for nem operon
MLSMGILHELFHILLTYTYLMVYLSARKEHMRDPVKTRRHILETAFGEIYQRGFQGVSVNEIVAKTSVTKGAFFHYFPTKNDLGYAVVDEIIKELTLERWIKPLTAYKNPIQGILERLRKIIESSSEEELGLGCPLNNLIQEMSSVDPVFREKLNAVMELWISEIEKYLKKAQADGYLKKEVNPRQVAEFVVAAHEGGFGMLKSFRNKKVFWSIYHSLRGYLNSVSEKP